MRSLHYLYRSWLKVKNDSSLVHASTVSIDGKGVLLRGVAGSGKSHLALSLIRRARQAGLQAGLVADDQTSLSLDQNTRIMATCPAPIVSKIEVRPFGIADVSAITVGPTPLLLIGDLADADADIDRVQHGNIIAILGQTVPHLILQPHQASPNCSAIFAALGLPCWY